MRRARRLATAISVALSATPAATVQAQPAAREPVTVFAAADLAQPFAEIAKAFEAARGIPVRMVIGATGHLALQIEHGAPADVFFAANVAFVDGLRAKGIVVPESERVYARGRLIVATAAKTGVSVSSLADLARADIKRIAIANPETAPYGAAARQALQSARLWEALRPKLVYGENVRQTLQFVESGAVDAGIVGATAARAPGIRATPVDARLHAPIDQAAAIVAASKHRAEARAFLDYVLGIDGRRVLARYGFAFPDSP